MSLISSTWFEYGLAIARTLDPRDLIEIEVPELEE